MGVVCVLRLFHRGVSDAYASVYRLYDRLLGCGIGRTSPLHLSRGVLGDAASTLPRMSGEVDDKDLEATVDAAAISWLSSSTRALQARNARGYY